MRAYCVDITKKWLLALLIAVLPCANEAFATRTVTGLQVNSPQELRAIAFRRHLENHDDTALDFYQKAIDQSTKEYGTHSTYTGDIYFEMGMLAYSLSKFTIAENCLTRAVQINPHAVVACLKLADLLKLRGKPSAACTQIQQSVEKNLNSPEARQQLAIWLQDTNPAQAAKQSFLLHQILLDIPLKTNALKNLDQRQGEAPVEAKQSAPEKPPAKQSSKASRSLKSKVQAKQSRRIESTASAAPSLTKSEPARLAAKKSNPTKTSRTRTAFSSAKSKQKRIRGQDTLQVQYAQPAPVAQGERPQPTEENHSKLTDHSPAEQKPAKSEPLVNKKHKSGAHDLVPPPPAMAPLGLDAYGQAIQLSTDARYKKGKSGKLTVRSNPEKPASPNKDSASNAPDDPDFLIKWASVQEKQKSARKRITPSEPN